MLFDNDIFKDKELNSSIITWQVFALARRFDDPPRRLYYMKLFSDWL